jgi:hypothetical protein
VASDLRRPSLHIGQAAAALIVLRDSAPVVDDLDRQLIVNADTHGQVAGPGMANGIADGFGDDGLGMVGQFTGDSCQRSRYVQDCGDVAVFGEFGDPVLNPLPKIPAFRYRVLQFEDRGPNVVDRALQIVERIGQPVGDLRRTCTSDGALYVETGRKKLLDDVVVQIMRNSFTVGEDRQFTGVFATGRQC